MAEIQIKYTTPDGYLCFAGSKLCEQFDKGICTAFCKVIDSTTKLPQCIAATIQPKTKRDDCDGPECESFGGVK